MSKTLFQTKIPMWVVVAAFILIAMLAVNYFNPTALPQTGLTGINVLSISQPNFDSSDARFANGTFQIVASAAQNSRTATATLSPDEAYRLFGVRTEKDVVISAALLKDDCKYEFSNVSSPIYSYEVKKSVTWSQTSAKYYCSDPGTTSGWTKIGSTGISCSPTSCACYGCTTTSGCEFVYKKQIGAVYTLDPSVIYDFALQLNMTADGKTYSAIITEQNRSVANEAFMAELSGSFMGAQSCPSAPNIAAYMAANGTSFKFIDKFQAQSVAQQGYSIVDGYSGVNNKPAYDAQYASMLSSTTNFGQYCSQSSSNNASLQTAFISCSPTFGVTIPVFNMYISAEKVGIHIPSGTPKILNATVTKVYSATRSDVVVTVRNDGETDSFETSIKGKYDINPVSTRAEIKAGETKNITIYYEGAGLISDYLVDVHSVNTPLSKDTTTVKLSIYPFCARGAPSPAHLMVFTAKGCAFVCPNYQTTNGTDVFDASCGEMSEYDRCMMYKAVDTSECIYYASQVDDDSSTGYSWYPKYWSGYKGPECDGASECDIKSYPNGTIIGLDPPSSGTSTLVCKITADDAGQCTQRASYSGYHCTDIGKYLTTNQYMDSVNSGSKSAFIPSEQSHKFFITTLDGVPVCNYIDEYGYSGGVEVTDLQFDYNQQFVEATSDAFLEPSTNQSVVYTTTIINNTVVIINTTVINQTTVVPEIPTEPPAGEPVTQPSEGISPVIIGFMVVGILSAWIYTYLATRKKR